MSKRVHDNENEDMTMKKLKPKDNRLMYHHVRTLKNLAAAKIAIALWLHQNIQHIRPSLGFDWQSPIPENEMLQEIHEIIEEEGVDYFRYSFPDPLLTQIRGSFRTLYMFKEIKEEVSKFLEVVKDQMEYWINYQFHKIFFDHDQREIFKYLNEVEWGPNGLVDYRASAKNMLKSPKITEMEKFRIVCTYCLEEEIHNVSPLLFTNKYREPVLLESHPLIYYWTCYITKKLHGIPFEGFNSVESKMITMKNVDNDCALKYFFSKFSEQDKLDNAKLLIHLYGVGTQIFALSQLNEAQQRQVLEQMAPEIITNFATPPYWFSYALTTWHHVKDFITGPQFVEIIGNLLGLWIEEDERGFIHLPELIIKIWRTTSDNLKRYAVNYVESEPIIAVFLEKPFMHMLNGSAFLLAMLPDLSDDTKKNVIRSDGCFLMFGELINSGTDVHLIHDFIKVCLPDRNEALEFKKRITKMRLFKHRCMHLSTSPKSVEEANKFIAEFLPDWNAVNVYREELFMSHFGFVHFRKIFDTADIEFSFLRTQIEKALPRSDKDFVRKFILSDEIIEKFTGWILSEKLNDVKTCLEEFRCDEILIEAVKTSIFRRYRDEHIIDLFSTLDGAKSGEFLLWCLNGENNVSQLKSNLPFDRIFVKMLEDLVFIIHDCKNDDNCILRPFFNFSHVDGFLRWFFESNEAMKKFKIDQINHYQQIDILIRHVWYLWKRENERVKTIFRWFFDEDRNEIEKFKASNKFCQFDIHEL